MQRLPDLLTSGHGCSLPLCDGTARRLSAALVAASDPGTSTALWTAAVSHDPALVIWSLGRAHQRGRSDVRNVESLAAWLSPAALDELGKDGRPASRNGSAIRNDSWLALAQRSITVATLARAIADQRRLDVQAAYLQGLVHNAPEWLAAAAGGSSFPPSEILPLWISEQFKPSTASPCGDIHSADGCARLATHLVQADPALVSLPDGIGLDRGALAGQLNSLAADWSEHPGGPLLAPLVEKLRRLRDLETRFTTALETEKLEALKEFAYGAGHEINNPLANISARAQTLLQLERDPDRRRMLASINAQAFRAHEMIADMMLFARPPAARMEIFDLAALVAQVRAELNEQAVKQRSRLELSVPAVPVEITADRTQIAVALRSLCSNALEALVTGGRIDVALAEPVDGHARITVADDGPGIPPEIRPHVFDPYFSGREAGRGLGLGLSKCWRIVTGHGGRIDVDSQVGRGTVFTVLLPFRNTA